MSNSVAEAYLLIVRESSVPIFGEAVPVPFTGQIELDGWSWDIKNDKARLRNAAAAKLEEAKKAAKAGKPTPAAAAAGAKPKSATPPIKADELIRTVVQMQNNKQVSQPDRDKKVLEMIKKAVKAFSDAAADDSPDDKKKEDDDKMHLTFEKGADLATTPLLYALARGDLIPRAILTVFNRSKNSPVTLAITLGDVRLTKYDVKCDPDDKMADVKETWEATYETVNWVYQNRPAAAGLGLGTNLAQGQARVFAMKKKFLSPF